MVTGNVRRGFLTSMSHSFAQKNVSGTHIKCGILRSEKKKPEVRDLLGLLPDAGMVVSQTILHGAANEKDLELRIWEGGCRLDPL